MDSEVQAPSMDASNLLKGQGWRGEGHSLDTTNRGLARPLLVQHKADALGIGNKKHDFSDQWWLTNFDKSLKGVGQPVVAAAPTDLPRLKGFKYNNLYTNFIKAEIMASTIEKDDPLFGKAFSDTKPMTEDPKEVAQRRSSFSTVGRKVLGLTEEEAVQATATTHQRKRKASDSTRPSAKAKKAKHDRGDLTASEDVEGAKSRKSKKETKEGVVRERKASKEYRAKMNAQKKLQQSQDADAGEEAATAVDSSKKRRKGSVAGGPDTAAEQALTSNDGDTSKKKKKRRRSKDKAETGDSEVLLDSGAVSAGTEEVHSKSVKDKKRKRTKERPEQAKTEVLQTAIDASVDTGVKKKDKKRRKTKGKEANDVEVASNDAETKSKSKKRKKAEADD